MLSSVGSFGNRAGSGQSDQIQLERIGHHWIL